MPDAAHSAWRVALRRAAHQLFEQPVVFADPFAVPLLGAAGQEALRRTPAAQGRAWSRSLRAFVVARSQFAEEHLHAAYARGVRQLCLVGAGLDTFALRNPYSDLHVTELDQEPVQQWKVRLVAEAGLHVERVTYATGDLETMPWPPAAMNMREPAFFAMLGVAPFLHRETLRAVLGRMRAFGEGSAVVFDYRLPRTELEPEEQRQHDSLQLRATAKGEPFRDGWSAEEIAGELRGFAHVEDLSRDAINTRYFAGGARQDGFALRGTAARLVYAGPGLP